jgi:hypothetical protein
MRILAKTCAILAVCLVAAGGAKAIDTSLPYVAVTIPDKPLHLGEVCGPNLREVGAKVTAHVVANIPYHISASFDGLRHQRSNVAISSKHLTATLNGRDMPIGTSRVPIASQGPTPRGGVDIPLDFQVGVKAVASYPAGRYRGTLLITVTPGH